jgi:hypothetical protein
VVAEYSCQQGKIGGSKYSCANSVNMFINGLFHEDSLAVMPAWMLAIAVSFSGNNSEFDSEIRQYIIQEQL